MPERTELWLIRMPAGMTPTAIQNAVDFAYLNAAEDEIGTDTHRPQICGVWREPSSFCTCTTVGRGSGFTLGQKFGWWVHSACHKPKSWWRNGLGAALFTALGKNQLENAPEEFRYEPPTWRTLLDTVAVQNRLGEDHPYARPEANLRLHPRREP